MLQTMTLCLLLCYTTTMLSSQHHNSLIADSVTMFTHCYENNLCSVRMWHNGKNVKYMVPTCNNTIEYCSVKLSKYDTS